MKVIFWKLTFNILKNCMTFVMIYHFFPERMKIIEKIEKLVPNVYDKEVHVIDKRNIKQTLSHGLVLKKEQRAINFNQIAWLKSNTDINTEVRKNAKQDFKKDFLR